MPNPLLPDQSSDMKALLEKIEQDGPGFGMSPAEIESLKKDCKLVFQYMGLYHKALLRKLLASDE